MHESQAKFKTMTATKINDDVPEPWASFLDGLAEVIIDDLERRIAEGDPTLAVYLSDNQDREQDSAIPPADKSGPPAAVATVAGGLPANAGGPEKRDRDHDNDDTCTQ